MFRTLVIAISFVFCTAPALAAEPARLRFSEECILKIVAEKMKITLRPEIAVPKVRYERQITLKDFQDAVEPLWKMRPDVVTNAFTPSSNQIFLMDDATYYARTKRAIDDSLAHEYTHFFQVAYKKVDITQPDDSIEMEAIDVQTWFRDTYISTGRSASDACGG